jgi:hypothetical protein
MMRGVSQEAQDEMKNLDYKNRGIMGRELSQEVDDERESDI